MPQTYDKSALNPKGTPQDPTKCAEEVYDDFHKGWHTHQCLRPKGHGKGGLFCKQHAKHHPEEKP